ncbi:3-dehydroquinate synthase [Thermodesulfobacteriota bacterium]
MKIIDIQGSTGYSTIRVGESLGNLNKYVPAGRALIITDSNVKKYYIKDFPPYEIVEIGVGEEIKTLDTVKEVYERLIKLEADRSCFVIGIGGGIVCDIAGFVASTYMRGVRFGFVSSTLLSQVDASVGGKNGVNFRGYKNMIGIFNQPEFVICDIDLLKTLPEREILCGMAEVVKHGAIVDADLFSFLEDNFNRALALDTAVLERLVYDSVVIKSSIVNRDEKEKGERKKLNFGHTFGHAIQKITSVPHGEAVSVGMLISSRISVKSGSLTKEEGKRIEDLLRKLRLPTSINFNMEKAIEAIRKDKKRKGDSIDFVLLRKIGVAEVEKIRIKELENMVRDIF